MSTTLISSLESGNPSIKRVSERFILGGETIFTLTFDIKSEYSSFVSVLITESEYSGSGKVPDNIKPIARINSAANVSKWQSYKIIYHHGLGILYYSEGILSGVNEFDILERKYYWINAFLPENTYIRNMNIVAGDSYTYSLLHFDSIPAEDMIDGNEWIVAGNPVIGYPEYAKFGNALYLRAGQNLTSKTYFDLGDEDFTLNYWIFSESSIRAGVKLQKRESAEVIALEINSGAFDILMAGNKRYSLNSPVLCNQKSVFCSITYSDKEETLYFSIDDSLIFTTPFKISSSEWRIFIKGAVFIDELRLCALALPTLIPKSQYILVNSIGNISVPDPIKENYSALSGIDYSIQVTFLKLMESFKSALIKVYTSYSNFNSDEIIPYAEKIYEIDLNNCFYYKDELLDPVYNETDSLKKYLDSLIGSVTIPKACIKRFNEISETCFRKTYTNTNAVSIPVIVYFEVESESSSKKFLKYSIKYMEIENSDEVLYISDSFEITANNYLNYETAFTKKFLQELSNCYKKLNSITKEIFHFDSLSMTTKVSDNEEVLKSDCILRVRDSSLILTKKNLRIPFSGIRLNLKNKYGIDYTVQ